MFRLPVCPHCGTVYRYQDTWKAIKNRENTCYHCRKKFKAKRFPYWIAGAALPLVLCVMTNMFLLSRMSEFQLLPLLASTLGYLLLIELICPFFTKLKKTEEEGQIDRKRKK